MLKKKKQEGIILVVSSPSGGGKSVLCRRLLRRLPDLSYSVSLTTRPRRGEEKEGNHYYFVSRRAFESARSRGKLAEWAEVHGELYGTPREFLEKEVRAGREVVLDVDVQGGLALKRRYRQAVLVFVLPPSLAVLESRLRRRRREGKREIARRMARARFQRLSFE